MLLTEFGLAGQLGFPSDLHLTLLLATLFVLTREFLVDCPGSYIRVIISRASPTRLCPFALPSLIMILTRSPGRKMAHIP